MLKKAYQLQVITDFITDYKKYFIVISLAAIILLGFQVRTEDYPQWLQHKNIFFIADEPVLVNADGYYYLRLAEDIKYNKYHNIDERRLVGDKVKRPLPPPLISIITAFTSNFTGLSLTKIAIFVSPVLASLIAIVIYLLSRALGVNSAASLLSSLLAVLSLSFVRRTALGFYDTDSMNVIFPLLECYFFIRFAQLQTLNRYYFLLGGLASFLLFLVWWEQAYVVVVGTFIVPFVFALWHYIKKPTSLLRLWIILVVFFILLVILLILGSIDFIKNFQVLFSDLFNSQQLLFPKFLTAIEIEPLSLRKIIDVTIGSQILFYLSAVSMLYVFITKFKYSVFLLAVIVLAMLPIYFGYRFTIYSAVIISLYTGVFVHYVWQFLQYKKQNNIVKLIFVLLFSVFFIDLSIGLYQKSAKGLTGPIAHRLFDLSIVVKKHTPADAVIWSTWTSGYIVTYYGKRSAVIDGSNALQLERQVYNTIPLASHSQSMSANFIKFYTVQGNKGMAQVYQLFANTHSGLVFIKKVLALDLNKAKQLINESIKSGVLMPTKSLKNSSEILKFLFPKSKRPIYLLLSPEVVQDGTWYQYGNWDIDKQKDGGVTVFHNFHNVYEKNGRIIVNNKFNFDKKEGWNVKFSLANADNEEGKIAHLFTKLNDGFEKIDYDDGNLAFEWIKPYKYGVLMSLEASKSVLNQLFIRHSYQPNYFKPIKLQTPNYQLWQVGGDIY